MNQALLLKATSHYISSQLNWDIVKEFTILNKKNIENLHEISFDLILVDFEFCLNFQVDLKNCLQKYANKLIFVCNHNRHIDMCELLSLKAKGFISLDVTPEEFLTSLVKVSQGESIVSSPLVPLMITTATHLVNQHEQLQKLTRREKEVIFFIAEGDTNKQIAHSLNISENTVKNHVHNILNKLDVKNRSNLVSYALQNGLVME